MLFQKFWRKRLKVIGAMMFVLILFALNLNALLKGKVEVNQADAWKLWILHIEKVIGPAPGGGVICHGNGFDCIWLDLGSDEGIQVPVLPR